MNEFTLTSDNVKLAGCLQVPSSGAPPWPCVLLCHGIPSGSPPEPGDPGYPGLMERIAGRGWASVYFNFRGTGASEGDFSFGGWLRDLETVADALLYGREPFDEMDVERLGVLAFSGGAATAIDCAARHHHFQAVVSMAAPADLAELMPEENLKEMLAHFKQIGIIRDEKFPPDADAWYQEAVALSPSRHVANVAPTPLLIVHGEADDVVPVGAAHQLFAAAGEPKELRVLPEAGHRLRLVHAATDMALDWLAKYLD